MCVKFCNYPSCHTGYALGSSGWMPWIASSQWTSGSLYWSSWFSRCCSVYRLLYDNRFVRWSKRPSWWSDASRSPLRCASPLVCTGCWSRSGCTSDEYTLGMPLWDGHGHDTVFQFCRWALGRWSSVWHSWNPSCPLLALPFLFFACALYTCQISQSLQPACPRCSSHLYYTLACFE